MHLKRVSFMSDTYPKKDIYPFNLDIFRHSNEIVFQSNLTFLVGENGAGKSTLLEATSHRCGFHIWRGHSRSRYNKNPYEKELFRYISLDWEDGRVPGSFFASDIFRNFARNLDEWASMDPDMLSHFGGKSLMSQSHGQSLMSLFKARYKIKGLYLLDEPETALSPKSQLELLSVLNRMSTQGHAQFIIATHSPILLACPGAVILSFDDYPIKTIQYEETAYYKLYKAFMEDRDRILADI
jgi:predicted ATPase